MNFYTVFTLAVIAAVSVEAKETEGFNICPKLESLQQQLEGGIADAQHWCATNQINSAIVNLACGLIETAKSQKAISAAENFVNLLLSQFGCKPSQVEAANPLGDVCQQLEQVESVLDQGLQYAKELCEQEGSKISVIGSLCGIIEGANGQEVANVLKNAIKALESEFCHSSSSSEAMATEYVELLTEFRAGDPVVKAACQALGQFSAALNQDEAAIEKFCASSQAKKNPLIAHSCSFLEGGKNQQAVAAVKHVVSQIESTLKCSSPSQTVEQLLSLKKSDACGAPGSPGEKACCLGCHIFDQMLLALPSKANQAVVQQEAVAICNKIATFIKPFGQQCLTYVNQYLPLIFNAARGELAPGVFCKTIGACYDPSSL